MNFRKSSTRGIGPLPTVAPLVAAVVAAVMLLGLAACSPEARQQRLREASAHYKLGISYLNEQMNQEAFVEFQKAVELNPNDREVHYALGHIYFVQMRYDEAVRSFRNAIRIDSDYSAAFNYLGKVYEAKGEPEQAIRQYRNALKNPVYATPDKAHYNLGLVLLKQGKRDEAVAELRQATLINPEHVLAYFALAQVYEEDGDYPKSIQSYQEILRRVPDSNDVRYELGWVYLKTGEKEKAAAEFAKIIEQSPDSVLGGRSSRHLGFLKSKSAGIRPGMAADRVLTLLGSEDRVVRRSGDAAGNEDWILSAYDLVLRFKDGRLVEYQQTPRK